LDPRRFTKVDLFFLFSFLVLLCGALVMFQTQSIMWAMTSLVGMFLAFCSMLLCIGMEDVFANTEMEQEESEDDEKEWGATTMRRNT